MDVHCRGFSRITIDDAENPTPTRRLRRFQVQAYRLLAAEQYRLGLDYLAPELSINCPVPKLPVTRKLACKLSCHVNCPYTVL